MSVLLGHILGMHSSALYHDCTLVEYARGHSTQSLLTRELTLIHQEMTLKSTQESSGANTSKDYIYRAHDLFDDAL